MRNISLYINGIVMVMSAQGSGTAMASTASVSEVPKEGHPSRRVPLRYNRKGKGEARAVGNNGTPRKGKGGARTVHNNGTSSQEASSLHDLWTSYSPSSLPTSLGPWLHLLLSCTRFPTKGAIFCTGCVCPAQRHLSSPSSLGERGVPTAWARAETARPLETPRK